MVVFLILLYNQQKLFIMHVDNYTNCENVQCLEKKNKKNLKVLVGKFFLLVEKLVEW